MPVAPVKPESQPAPPDEAVKIEFDADKADALIEAMEEGKEKWVRVVEIKDGQPGAWITGQFEKPNRIVISVEGAEQFELDTSKLDIDWTKRVVLRINEANSELTRKKSPVIQLKQSAGGGWYVVDEKKSNEVGKN